MDDSPATVQDAKNAAQAVIENAVEVKQSLEETFNSHLQDELVFRNQTEKSLAAIHERLGTLPKQEDMLTKTDVVDSLNAYFQNKGKMLFTLTVSAGILMGAITGIFVGLKAILAAFGFMLIHK